MKHINLRKGGFKLDKTPSLDKPSLVVTNYLKMEVAYALCNATTLCVYKKNGTLLKEGLQCLLLSTPY